MPGASAQRTNGDELRLIDLLQLGQPRVIGAWLAGDVLVDPGPSSRLQTLLEGLDGREPRAIALTHIHLDHAGATGTLARRFPRAEVWVHERGARHLVNPERLLASATRLYGAEMERLWGEVLPVPAERVRALSGGERVGEFLVEYTPGHASHHVSYLHEPTGTAFTGDVMGVRIGEGPVLAPTPPPDIDLAAWRASLELVERWRPARVAPTHFGVYEDVDEHLAAIRERLDTMERLAATLDEDAFVAAMRAEIAATSTPETAASYETGLPPGQSYQGLARYLQAHAG